MHRILVIEDDEDTREIVESVLSNEGYDVDTARDGLDGLDHLHGLQYENERKPDLVLLDIQMPNLDGYEFLCVKNSDRSVLSIPVIVVTGLRHKKGPYSLPNTVEIIHKPFSLEKLLGAVEKVLPLPRQEIVPVGFEKSSRSA